MVFNGLPHKSIAKHIFIDAGKTEEEWEAFEAEHYGTEQSEFDALAEKYGLYVRQFID